MQTKQAEKEYLARTGSSAWERAKPFSPPGSDTLGESAWMLHDFASAMLALQPAPSDRILDLGAGAGWCSDLLGRLNRSAVAVDISLDMLRAGRSRTGATIRAVAGDMEQLPFLAGTFHKAVCLSAVHHVPDVGKALQEISRVLTDDGVALFSEPGQGHAEAPVASAAVRDFGVLEQDILVAPFIRQCQAAGFQHVTLRPLLHAVPGFEVVLDEWQSWARLAASTRPRRALAKIAFGVAEVFGLGKRRALFEEAMAVRMVRTLRQVVEHHPIIVAAKTRPPVRTGREWDAAIEVEGREHGDREGGVAMRVTVTNRGWGTWKARSGSGFGHVTLGIQLLDAGGRLLARDYHRVPLPHDVPPGGAVPLAVACPRPREPGDYRLKLDMVAEGVAWFETTGSAPAFFAVQVH